MESQGVTKFQAFRLTMNAEIRWMFSRGPKPQYQSDPFYKGLLKTYEDQLSAPWRREQGLLAASREMRACSAREKSATTLITVLGACAIPILIAVVQLGASILVLSIVLLVVALVVRSSSRKRFEDLKSEILSNHSSEIAELESIALDACKKIGDSWDSYCIHFPGYPPDWDERRRIVKQRDDGTCTKCGWPIGFRRRTRNLNAHHVKPLSQGGDNSLENLVTLCHLCHRGEPGPGHKGVQYTKQRRKRPGRNPWRARRRYFR